MRVRGTAHLEATYLPPQFRVIKSGAGWAMRGMCTWSNLGREMENGTLQVPPNTPLLEAAPLGEVPHVMVSDAAFPLKAYLMKPYPGQDLTYQRRIFNDQLSRARRVGENTFGILAFRYRTPQQKMQSDCGWQHVSSTTSCILQVHQRFWMTQYSRRGTWPLFIIQEGIKPCSSPFLKPVCHGSTGCHNRIKAFISLPYISLPFISLPYILFLSLILFFYFKI